MTSNNLTLSDIRGSDPLARLLFENRQTKPFVLAICFIFAGFLYAYLLPVFVWRIEPVADAVSIFNIVLIFPVAGYFYAYQPSSILRVYQSVQRFLREENEALEIPYDKLRRWHAGAGWWLAGTAFGAISAGFGTLNALRDFGVWWTNYNWFQIVFVQLIRFLAMAMLGTVAARHIAASLAFNNLLQRAHFPLTLDTERLEVFRETRRFSLEIVGMIAVLGFNLGLQPLTIVVPMPEYAFYVVAYFLVAPVSFFLPLWQTHRRMSAIKEEMLDKLHKDFQEESEKLYQSLAREAGKDLSEAYLKNSEDLSAIKNAIKTIEEAPDWPFQGTTIYRVALTVVSPFVIAVGDALKDWADALFFK